MDTIHPHPSAPARASHLRDASAPAGPAGDAELIASSMREPEAFKVVFERYWEDLYRFCLNRAGGAGEDIAAEAFRVAFDQRRRYKHKYPDARPWLFGIATNLLRDHFRSCANEEEKLGRSALLEPGSPDDEAVSALERQFLGPDLTAALAGIPSGDRDALLLLAWAELTYEQIAEALGTPVGTVRSRISRARQRVREHLAAGQDHRSRNEA